ncbi:MAG TPA: hypothetical protein VHZ50_15510 [Puia sp.]|jgi:hypothetical protein|nr:hypothetical protein [Puia sp.]
MKSIKTPTNFSYTGIIIFFISILIFAISCQKNTNPVTVPTKPIPPTNPTGSTIIYTDVNPDSSILLTSDSFDLDLNNDGITDFTFNKSLSSTQCRSAVQTTFTFHIHLSITPANTNNAAMTSASNIALALDADSATTIGPDSLWATTSEVLLEGVAISNCTPVSGHAGYWLNVSDKYLGLKFTAGNNTYYGWARLSSTYSVGAGSDLIIGGQLILKDYAYNSAPNQPILAGQTK